MSIKLKSSKEVIYPIGELKSLQNSIISLEPVFEQNSIEGEKIDVKSEVVEIISEMEYKAQNSNILSIIEEGTTRLSKKLEFSEKRCIDKVCRYPSKIRVLRATTLECFALSTLSGRQTIYNNEVSVLPFNTMSFGDRFRLPNTYYSCSVSESILNEDQAETFEQLEDLRKSNRIKLILLSVWFFVGFAFLVSFVPFILNRDIFGMRRVSEKSQNLLQNETVALVSEVMPDRYLGGPQIKVKPLPKPTGDLAVSGYVSLSGNISSSLKNEQTFKNNDSNFQNTVNSNVPLADNFNKSNEGSAILLFKQILAFLILKFILEILWKTSWHFSEYIFFKIHRLLKF